MASINILKIRDSMPPSNDFEETREQLHRQMFSVLSHDLKTPLATMIGALEVYTRMGEKLSPEKKQMLVKSALSEAYRLDSFVTNILDMCKLESGMAKANSECCNLTSVIQDSIIRLGPKVRIAAIKLIPVGEQIAVHTDPALLGRAVGILLDNALKHAGKNPVIIVEFGCEGGQAYIRVCDDGPGILPEQMEAIFSKYTRFSKTDQQNAGTGLGLAICRLIMELLSGSVCVSNSVQSGAEFTLRFSAY